MTPDEAIEWARSLPEHQHEWVRDSLVILTNGATILTPTYAPGPTRHYCDTCGEVEYRLGQVSQQLYS